jgi:hypothetical protein
MSTAFKEQSVHRERTVRSEVSTMQTHEGENLTIKHVVDKGRVGILCTNAAAFFPLEPTTTIAKKHGLVEARVYQEIRESYSS